MQMGIGEHICHKCSNGRSMYRFLREVAIKFRASPKWGVRWEKQAPSLIACPRRYLPQGKSPRPRPKCLPGRCECVRKKNIDHKRGYPPSSFPPALNNRPSSRALRPKGISSSTSKIVSKVPAVDVVLKRRCDTLRAREQSASESMPAKARRGSCEPLVTFEARNVCRKRTTSSSTSSSHRLSLSPSDASTRMSSARTGSVITCAMPGGVLDAGPSCSGVLNWGRRVRK